MRIMKLKRLAILVFVVTLLGGCSTNKASNFYNEGLKYFKNGDYELAETNIAKAIKINSERAEYFIDYGMTLIMLNKSEEALQYFDKAILDKDNAIVNKNNKKAYRGKGIAYYKGYRYAEAIEQFNMALVINELSDLNMDILYYKGNSQEKAGLYDQAIITFTDILTKNSSDATTYYSRAFVYQKTGNYDKSLADYDKAISLDKSKYDFYFGKYFLMLGVDNKEGATSVLEEAAGITVETQEDKFNLGKIHYYMGDYDSAVNELSEAFRNGFTLAYIYLGEIYEKKGDYESAIYNYQMFIDDETTEKTGNIYNQIGNCLIKLERYEEALTNMEIGLAFNDISLNPVLKRNQIVVNEYLSRYEEAYRLMASYLKLYPDDEEAIEENEFLKTRLQESSNVKEDIEP